MCSTGCDHCLMKRYWICAVQISIILLLGNSSPIIVSVVGVMKDISLVVSSVVIFGVELSHMQVGHASITWFTDY
jgi:hypothetical protein